MLHIHWCCCTGVVRPQHLSAVTSGIAFHPLSASLAAAAATRPGFYFAAQPGAAVPGLVTSSGIIPATSLAGVGNAGAREAGMIH